MFSKPFMSLRRFSGLTLTFLFFAACLCAGSQAQTAPAAIASFATGMNHNTGLSNPNPTTIGTLGTIANIATDSSGDLLAVDANAGALYEFPAGGGDAIILVPAGGLAGTAVDTGGAKPIVTPGIAIDAANNLYIEGGSCILMYPYPWSGLSALGSSKSSTACGTTGVAPTFYNFGSGSQPWGLAVAGSPQSLLVGVSPTGVTAGGSIVSIPLTGTPTPATIISGMSRAPISVAADASGNTYFVETGSGAPAGAYVIPAGSTAPTSDSGLTRIDPSLAQVTGVAVDSKGNVYISDNEAANATDPQGVFVLPQGATSSSAAFLVSSVPAQGGVAFFGNAGLFIPTTQTQSNNYGDVAQVSFSVAQFGPVTVGSTKPATASVTISFNASTTKNPIVEVIEAGKSTPDFSIASASNTCLSPQLPAPYGPQANAPDQASCPVAVSFAPQAAGNVSATLVMLDANNALLASIPLNGTGNSAAVQVSPAAQSTIGTGALVTPGQIAVDAAGNLYVADSGSKAVLMYPASSGSSTAGTPVGTGLTAPTGVAVDGAGDVFIADSGSVYEVPESLAGGGLNATGQITLQTGLGAQVQLAADGLGDLYVADMSNQKVYELQNFSTGWNASLPGVLTSQTLTLSGAAFSTPSAIAVDSNNNLFVVNGSSVYEVTPANAQTQVLTGVSGITSLAVDPSGSVYATMAGGTVRIPSVGGTLNAAAKTAVAASVTNPAGVAIDALGNIYVADGSALDVNFTSASASVNFGTVTVDPVNGPAAGTSTTQAVTVLNYGNMPLAVTSYNSPINYFEPVPDNANATTGVPAYDNATNGVSYTEADFTDQAPTTPDTCLNQSVAIDATCTTTITFSPAPGDGGSLSGQVLVVGNVSNTPVGVNGTGTAPTLAGTTTTMTASAKGTIEGVPVSVTVAPNASGSPTPTGTVTLTVQYGSDVPLTNPALPVKYQLTAPLVNGTASFVQPPPTGYPSSVIDLPIAHYTFTARYNGDTTYIYANSNNAGPVVVTIAVPTALTQPTIAASAPNTPPADPSELEPYTLPCTSGTPSSCTTDYSLGQPSGNPAGYLVPGGLCGNGCIGSWGFDGSADLWYYKYDVTMASASANPMIGLAAYGGGTSENGWNYGSVNNLLTATQSMCGNLAGSGSIDNAANVVGNLDIELAEFPVSCGPIESSANATTPIFMNFYSFTPNYSGIYNDLTDNNPNYLPSKGSAAVNVWAVANPVVQISSSPATITVPSGGSAQATLTISSVLGYGYVDRGGTGGGNPNYAMPLALQCQGLPAYASCSFSYPTPNPADQQGVAYPGGIVTSPSGTVLPQAIPAFAGLLCPDGITYCAFDVGPPLGSVQSHASSTTPCDAPTDGCLGPGTVLMTITTNVPVGGVSSLKTYTGTIACAGLFGLGLLGLGFRRRASRFGWMAIVGFLLLGGGGLTGITACSTTNLGTTSTGATPAGSYWVTVTASQVGTFVIPPKNSGQPEVGNNAPVLVTASGKQMSLPYTVYVTIQ